MIAFAIPRPLAYLGRHAEAAAEFDGALALDPRHAAAADGRRRALAGAAVP